MTEAEWLACTEPGDMLQFLLNTVSERKGRLFVVACCRNVWDELVDERSKNAVVFAELFADGIGDDNGLRTVRQAAATASQENPRNASAKGVILAVSKSSRHITSFLRAGRAIHCHFLRDIFPNPFRPIASDPGWLTTTVLSLAKAIYEGRAFDRLPILADALEEAGCTNADILSHCRQVGEHVRGCWLIDLLLGKE